MAGVPIKFRCFQCNQLLGVSRSKAGSIVACPKCATELIVPAPDDGPAAAESASSAGAETTPAFLAAIAEGLPVELAEIRLEDIRINPEYPRHSAPASAPATVPAAAPDLDPIPDVPPPPPYVSPKEVARTPEPDALRLATVPTPPPPLGVEPALPPIKIEPPSLINERIPRARDLVLPRSVVASWSLFVLLAQALAFLAGLLAGHFVWRVH